MGLRLLPTEHPRTKSEPVSEPRGNEPARDRLATPRHSAPARGALAGPGTMATIARRPQPGHGQPRTGPETEPDALLPYRSNACHCGNFTRAPTGWAFTGWLPPHEPRASAHERAGGTGAPLTAERMTHMRANRTPRPGLGGAKGRSRRKSGARGRIVPATARASESLPIGGQSTASAAEAIARPVESSA